MRTLSFLCALLLCVGSAYAITTDPNPITCPSSSEIWSWPLSGEFPLATYVNSDGTTWYFGQYIENSSSSGQQMGIFRRLYDVNNQPTSTCYNTSPDGTGLDGYWAGWVNDWWDGVSFSAFDGSGYSSSDGGANWTKTTCEYSGFGDPTCPIAPSTTTSCYQRIIGTTWLSQTCSAGQFCHFAGYTLGHPVGQCVTPCKWVASHDNCGCVAKVNPDGSGNCPSGWTSETADGACVMSGFSSACWGY